MARLMRWTDAVRSWVGMLVAIAALVVVGGGAALLIGSRDGSTGATTAPSAAATTSAEPTGSAPGEASASEAPTAAPTPAPIAGPWQITWTRVEGFEPGAEVDSVRVIDGTWFAGGSVRPEARIWTSADGATWTAAQVEQIQYPQDVSPTGETYHVTVADVIQLGDSLVAVGGWGLSGSEQYAWAIWRSGDGGATWAVEADQMRPGMRAGTAGGPGAVGVAWQYGGTTPFDSDAFITQDGAAWERHTPEAWTEAMVTAVAAVGDRLVAVGQDMTDPDGDPSGPPPAAWFSDDGGLSWTQVAVPMAAGDQGIILGVTVTTEGHLVAVGGSGSIENVPPYSQTSVPTAWTSADGGQTWQAHQLGAEGHGLAIAAAPDGLVAVGNAGPWPGPTPPEMAWSSGDGVTWQDAGPIGAGDLTLQAVAVLDGVVVAGGTCVTYPPECGSPLWRGEIGE